MPGIPTTCRPRAHSLALRIVLGTMASLACGGGGTDSRPVPAVGSVTVSTTTSGADPDPDGYGLLLDAVAHGTIGANASRTLTQLDTGSVTLGLAGVAANCAVGGTNPRTATVTAGQDAPVAFAITCTAIPPTTGSVALVTSTTGLDIDPDGYDIAVDGGATHALAANDTLYLTGLSPGQHSVLLSNTATNCSATTPFPQGFAVSAGDTTTAQFTLGCLARNGTVGITTTTTGRGLDADGFVAAVDGGASQAVATNGTLILVGLHEGTHTLALSGNSSNCAFLSPQSLTVTIVYGDTTAVPVAARCVGTLHGRIIFTSSCHLQFAGRDVYCGLMSMAPDGSGREMITLDTVFSYPYDYPDVSPDGTRIAFARFDSTHNYGLWTVDSTGNGQTPIQLPFPAWEPKWSPSGSEIAFSGSAPGSFIQTWLMNADGSQPHQVSPVGFDIGQPAWAPSGQRLAADSFGIYVAFDTNGANYTRDSLIVPVFDLTWSGDGTLLLASGNALVIPLGDIFSFHPNGSALTQLTNTGMDTHARFSSDGQHIVYTHSQPTSSQVMIMNADGSSPQPLSGSQDLDAQPLWGPP